MHFNEIDEHVEANADTLHERSNFCEIYKIARPILFFAKSILFFKPKWQAVLTALIANLDSGCQE